MKQVNQCICICANDNTKLTGNFVKVNTDP